MNNKWIKSSLSLAILASFSTLVAAEQSNNVNADAKLDTIVVTASGSAVNVKDAPASISVISSEDIAKQPVKSISELLSKVPGVSGGLGLNGEGGKIKLRGLPSEYSLILVDGRRVGNSSRIAYRSDLQRQDLNWINPENIERIEIVKGPMSSLYGSDAMGGVINIITKKAAQEWGGSATINFEKPASSTEGETLQISATASGAITDTLSTRFTLGRTERQADSNVTDIENSTTGMRNDTVEASLFYRPTDNHSFELFGNYGTQENTNPTYAPNVNDGEFWLGAAGEKNETEYKRIGLSWDGKYAWGGSSNISIYTNQYDRSTTTETDGVFSPTVQKTNLTVADAKLSFPFKAIVPNKLTVGTQLRSEDLTNTRTLGIDSNGAPSIDGQDHTGKSKVSADVWAVFFEDMLEITDQFTLTLGGRYDKDERYAGNFSPRAYGVFHFNDALTFKGGVSTAFRAPDLVQTAAGFSTGSRGKGCSSQFGAYDPITNPNGFQSSYSNSNPFVNCYTTGNPDLEAEESTSYELGFQYDDQKYSGGLTYFHTNFDNKLVNKPVKHISAAEINNPRYPNGVWYVAVDNAEKARIRGIEGSFAVNFSDAIRWSNNATYFIQSENLDTKTALIDTPKLSLSTALDYQATDVLALQANAQYIGKQYTTDNEIADAWTKAYALFGVNANYKMNDKTTLRTGVTNLFNEKIETTDGAEDYHTLQGRTYFVGLTTRF